MTVLHALILGIVQGLGELLPVSGSAHLVVIPWYFRWNDPGITFEIVLHMGSLLAVTLYFRKDWFRLFRAVRQRQSSDDKHMFCYLVAATVPGGLIGLALEKKAETVFRSPLLIGIMMIVMGILLYIADQKRQLRNVDTLTIGDAIWIGLSQALAIIPGVSRIGCVMTTARFLDLTREDAARISFLMSAPILLGEGILKFRYLAMAVVDLPFVVGVISAFIVSLLSISFLLWYLKSGSLTLFVGYRLIFGVVVIGLALAGH